MATNSRNDPLRHRRMGLREGSRTPEQYMIAAAQPRTGAQSVDDRIRSVGGAEILRTFPAREPIAPPVTVARISDEGVRALHQAFGGALVVEPDIPLRAASVIGASSLVSAPVGPMGPGFTVTVQVMAEGRPVEQAEVQILGERWGARGVSGPDGKVALNLEGELPGTVVELLVAPRAGYWPLHQYQPLEPGGVTVVTVHRLSPAKQHDWSGAAMGFDQLPIAQRGAGVSIALIDGGVATGHRQLKAVAHGIDLAAGARSDARSWAEDVAGSHGTSCAGIISAAPDATQGIRGYAPQSELHVCKLPAYARCSDLLAAIDYCLEARVDVACLGYGCPSGSLIVEQRIVAAKERGVALIAAAGNTGAAVQFPACSMHVLAIGAIGQVGTFPDDSPEAAQAAGGLPAAQGLFVPPYACHGPELDLCAPGVAVLSCASPDGYAVYDGSSLAAAHVTALAALVLAEHGDFRLAFSERDFRRVERLFQILKETARPVGHPWQTGAGLPDAARALGRTLQPTAVSVPLDVGLGELRSAMRRIDAMHASSLGPVKLEPPRGPAIVAPVPLNPYPWSVIAGAGAPADFQALKAAMQQAGLASIN